MTYFTTIMEALREEISRQGHHADDELLQYYALLVLTTGVQTTARDVHNAWAAWRTVTRPDHPDLVPFSEFPEETKKHDIPYALVIQTVAAGLEGNES